MSLEGEEPGLKKQIKCEKQNLLTENLESQEIQQEEIS